mmetsp:Transcript_5587/g.12083  ORF Transcript_5587/g.12083 Transcript_5587/m.12083 type:complete len:239 (-) Transcript_5587:1265-1981(-)
MGSEIKGNVGGLVLHLEGVQRSKMGSLLHLLPGANSALFTCQPLDLLLAHHYSGIAALGQTANVVLALSRLWLRVPEVGLRLLDLPVVLGVIVGPLEITPHPRPSTTVHVHHHTLRFVPLGGGEDPETAGEVVEFFEELVLSRVLQAGLPLHPRVVKPLQQRGRVQNLREESQNLTVRGVHPEGLRIEPVILLRSRIAEQQPAIQGDQRHHGNRQNQLRPHWHCRQIQPDGFIGDLVE